MQTVILAGGLGTRLAGVSNNLPKALMPVCGRPFLEHQLRWLAKQGFQHVLLLTAHLADQIESHFGDGESFGLTIQYSREVSPRGTAKALCAASSFLEEEFLLLYGDSYLPTVYSEVISALRFANAVGVISAYKDTDSVTGVEANVVMGSDNRVTNYSKSPEETDKCFTHIEAGVSAYKKDVLAYISSSQGDSLETHVLPQMIASNALYGIEVNQRFFDIGTPTRLVDFERWLESRVDQ